MEQPAQLFFSISFVEYNFGGQVNRVYCGNLCIEVKFVEILAAFVQTKNHRTTTQPLKSKAVSELIHFTQRKSSSHFYDFKCLSPIVWLKCILWYFSYRWFNLVSKHENSDGLVFFFHLGKRLFLERG